MKPIASLALLTVTAAGCTSGQQTIDVADPPARTSGAVSALAVPTSCPIYTPGDYDVDTPELPYDSPLLFGCGVDSTGATYGMATGDGGLGALALVPGGREIGNFYEFDDSVADEQIQLAALGLGGPNPLIRAWAAPVNINSETDCCAENNPDAEIPVTVVALGVHGMLLSYGQFDASTSLQIATLFDPEQLFPGKTFAETHLDGERFYVNGPPEWTPCGVVTTDSNGNNVCGDPQPPTTGAWPPSD